MTKLQFAKTAAPLPVAVAAEPKLTRPGSCGWQKRGTMSVVVDGVEYRALYTVNVTIRGSKKWPTH